jgi:hypothetical protein
MLRPRASGGFEPDDTDQAVLVEFWHVSRVFGPDRQVRLGWVVDHFLAIYPEIARKWIYVWCERYLGRMVDPDPIQIPADMQALCQSSTDARTVPSRSKRSRSKKRAK